MTSCGKFPVISLESSSILVTLPLSHVIPCQPEHGSKSFSSQPEAVFHSGKSEIESNRESASVIAFGTLFVALYRQ